MPRGIYPRSLEHNANLSASLKGRVVSAETRAKLSATLKGRRLTTETRAKMGATRKGLPLSEQHRAALSAAQKGRKFTDEHRAAATAGLRSPAARAKLSASKTIPWEQKGYSAIHNWVRINFEDPGVCEDCGASDVRLDWASIGHTYTANRSDWLRLCVPCHRHLDAQG